MTVHLHAVHGQQVRAEQARVGCKGDVPNPEPARRTPSTSNGDSARCMVTSAPVRSASARVSRSVASSTVQLMHGASPTLIREPGRSIRR